MSDDGVSFLRQLDFFNPEEDAQPIINLIGCGGIGSYVGLYLATMGFKNIIGWDADFVDNHNLPNQAFTLKHLGMKKTDALADMIVEKVGVTIKTKNRFFTEDSHVNEGIVIAATDSISSRKLIWKEVKNKPGIIGFIDGRLGGLATDVYIIDPNDPDDITFYEESLFGEGEAMDLPCTARAVIFIAAEIAATICEATRELAKGLPHYRNVRKDHLNGVMEFDGQALIAVKRK